MMFQIAVWTFFHFKEKDNIDYEYAKLDHNDEDIDHRNTASTLA